MLAFAKKMFGARKGRKEEQDAIVNTGTFTPLGIRLASTIEITDIAYSIYAGVIDTDVYKGDRYTIDYITEYTVFDDLKIFRIVVDSNCFIFVVDDGENPEAIVFHKTSEVYPQTSAAWEEWIAPDVGIIYDDAITDDYIQYTEFWTAPQEVIAKKYTHSGDSTKTYLHKMFARKIELADGEESEEFLLAEVEDEQKVCVYTGVMIPTFELTVI